MGRRASRRRRDSVDPDAVFLNVPFDTKYEALFVSLIGAVIAVGRKPRCVLELPSDHLRLGRIFRLLEATAVSLHDVSRVSTARTPQGRVPRFNMPFELGLACALTLSSRQHRFFVLEERQHRLQISLSDLNGYDPLIHRGSQKGMIAAVLNMLGRENGRDPDPVQVARLCRNLRQAALAEKKKLGDRTLFTRTLFRRTVELAVALAQSANLLQP